MQQFAINIRVCHLECGKPPGRIVGGGPALIQQYPWTVALVRDSWLGLTNKPFCGGTLINDRYVRLY